MPKPKLAFALACLAVISCGCGTIQEAAGGAQQLTQDLLTLINQGDYVGIREMMSGTLQDRFQAPNVESAFRVVREEAGCGAPRILNFNSNVSASGSRLTLGFAADCTRGPIQGTLVWRTEEAVRKLDSFVILRLIASSDSVPTSDAQGEVAQLR